MAKLIDFNAPPDPNAITHAHRLPALGIDAMEKAGRFFHVINAKPSHGNQLAETFGHDKTLLVDGGNWDWMNIPSQADILNKTGGGPCRVVMQNLGQLKENDCWPLQELMKLKDAVKSWWFMDAGEDSIPVNIDHKILMQCRMADAAVLLDAVAFGWGAKNPYDGTAVGGEDADLSDDLDFSDSGMGAPEDAEYAVPR